MHNPSAIRVCRQSFYFSLATSPRTESVNAVSMRSGYAIPVTANTTNCSLLFQQFDRLLLLASGGRTVYFGDIGPNSETLVNYFVSRGGHPCGKDENPAEWMLNVIGAAPGSHTDTDWHAAWRSGDEYQRVQKELLTLESLSVSAPNPDDDPATATQYAAPFRTQFWMVLRRVFQQYWRTPSYIYSKLILCCGTVSPPPRSWHLVGGL